MATKHDQVFSIIDIIAEEVFEKLYPIWKNKDIKSLYYRDDYKATFRDIAHKNGLYHGTEKKRYNNIFRSAMGKVNAKIRSTSSYEISKNLAETRELEEEAIAAIMLDGALQNIIARHDDICPPD